MNISFDKLIYSTFLGDTHNDEINGLKVDPNGVVYVVGSTGSTNFPVTPDAENGTHSGGFLDAFFTKMNASGNGLLYSTFRGGSSSDYGYCIAISNSGDIYVAGVSSSTDFPTTPGAFSGTHKGGDDCMVFKFSMQTIISPPRNLDGVLGYGYVDLTWEPPLDMIPAKLTEYKLYRGTSSGGETLLASPGNVTHYNDTSIQVGQHYYYYVTALNITGESFPSNRYHATDMEKPRVVIDNTPGSGTTGEEITFDVELTDNLEVNGSWVEYWFGTESHSNISMLESEPNIWTYDVEIPSNSIESLFYIIHSEDIFKNWNETHEKKITILDNDIPILIHKGDDKIYVDFSDPVTTGDNYSFRVGMKDNVQMYGVWFEYWFGTGTHENISMVEDIEYIYWWKTIITIPHSLEKLHFIFHGNDTSNNWNQTVQYDVRVIDNDNPIIWPNLEEIPPNPYPGYEPGPAYTGDEYTFRAPVIDNIAVDTVWVEYWYGSGIHDNLSMALRTEDNPWYKDIIADHTLEKLHFIYHANDTSDNWNYSQEFIVDVIDNDKPEFWNDSSLDFGTTGDQFIFSIQAVDNIEIYNLTLEYWFFNDDHTRVELTPDADIYSHTITVPSDSLEPLNYYFKTYDTSGNWNKTDIKAVTISDNDPPSFWELPTEKAVNTGDLYQVKVTIVDNIGVKNATMNYWFGADEPDKFILTDSGSFDEYVGEVNIPVNSLEPLYLKFSAMDTSMNMNVSQTIIITIKDNIPPVVQPIQDLEINIGEFIDIKAIASDNIGIDEITWINAPVTPTGANLSGIVDQGGDFQITVTAYDATGNSDSVSFNLTVVELVKNGDVEPVNYSIFIILIVVIIIIAIILVLFLMKRKRRREEPAAEPTLQQQIPITQFEGRVEQTGQTMQSMEMPIPTPMQMPIPIDHQTQNEFTSAEYNSQPVEYQPEDYQQEQLQQEHQEQQPQQPQQPEQAPDRIINEPATTQTLGTPQTPVTFDKPQKQPLPETIQNQTQMQQPYEYISGYFRCPQCGIQLTTGTKICSSCGYQIFIP